LWAPKEPTPPDYDTALAKVTVENPPPNGPWIIW
jgi:hypothetical protein